MLGIGKTALAVLATGPLLGALLASAADPVMKAAPEEPWRANLQATGAAPAPPEPEVADPAWYAYPDSYGPSWLDEQVTDWTPEYPEWTFSDFADEAAPAPLEETPIEPPETDLAAQEPAAEAEPLAPPLPRPGLGPLY